MTVFPQRKVRQRRMLRDHAPPNKALTDFWIALFPHRPIHRFAVVRSETMNRWILSASLHTDDGQYGSHAL